jgi:hypothetical protein
MFKHGHGYLGSGAIEGSIKIKGHSAPVHNDNGIIRIYGDVKKESGPKHEAVLDLARFEEDDSNPGRGKIKVAFSEKTTNCDRSGSNARDSKHIRFCDEDAVLIKNQTRLITIQTRITSDEVTNEGNLGEWLHTFETEDTLPSHIKQGDHVYIRSITGTSGLSSTYVRGRIWQDAPGRYAIRCSTNRPFYTTNPWGLDGSTNASVMFILNRLAVPTTGGGDANDCDLGEKLLGGETDVSKFKVGDSIQITNKNIGGGNFTITDMDTGNGTIDFDGKLPGHIQWWTFDQSGAKKTQAEQDVPYEFNSIPEIKNETTPCMIRVESRTNLPNSWKAVDTVTNTSGIRVVFDGRVKGAEWELYERNANLKHVFYVKPDSIDASQTMLCSECSCAFKLRITPDQREGTFKGPRSTCAIEQPTIREHLKYPYEYPTMNPVLTFQDTTAHALKVLDSPGVVDTGNVQFHPYMCGYLGQDAPTGQIATRLTKLMGSTRIDYIEFEAGDYTP